MLGCTFKGYSRGDISEDEKSVENQDNRRNCQQVYSSSPIKHSNGKNDTPAGSTQNEKLTINQKILKQLYFLWLFQKCTKLALMLHLV